MLTRPAGLADEAVSNAVAAGWSITVVGIEHAPVGFDSHHWRAVADDGRRWFVTVDDLVARCRSERDTEAGAGRRLAAALGAAGAARDAGLDFVIAPHPTRAGGALHPIGGRFVVSLYPHIEGITHAWGRYPTAAARAAVVDRLADLHRAGPNVRAQALVDDIAVPRRDELEVALVDPATSWSAGPYAERARRLLARTARPLAEALARHDALAAAVRADTDRWVLTHGEPHPGNTITTADGVVLVDWDTALVAPPERDLWSLVAGDAGDAGDAGSIAVAERARGDADAGVVADVAVTVAYAERTGVTLAADALRLYRDLWDLTDVSLYVSTFRRPHADTADTADTAQAWDGLVRQLDPDR